MATAKNCFAENLQLIGTPPVGRDAQILWNLSNGLRMLAEQMDQVQSAQRSQEHTLQILLQHARGQR